MERSGHKTTVLTISAGLMILFLLTDILWMLYIALGIVILSLLSGKITALIHASWYWLAEKIGFVVSRIILGITFIFVLIPLGALSRIFRKDFMMLSKREDSYFTERNHLFQPKDMNDPW